MVDDIDDNHDISDGVFNDDRSINNKKVMIMIRTMMIKIT